MSKKTRTQILKIDFLHEKILFFGLDFFPVNIWLCSFRKTHLYRPAMRGAGFARRYVEKSMNLPSIRVFSRRASLVGYRSRVYLHGVAERNWFQNPTRRRLEGEGPSTRTTKVAKTFLVLLNVSWWSRLLRACYKRQETGSFRILAEILRKCQLATPIARIWLHVRRMDSFKEEVHIRSNRNPASHFFNM